MDKRAPSSARAPLVEGGAARQAATTRRAWPAGSSNPAEVVVPFPTPLTALRAVRSTLIIASVAAIRDRGLYDEYVSHLEPKFDEMILGAVAGAWLDEEVARAHYRACDALSLTAGERVGMGEGTGRGLQQHLTHFVGTVSRSSGVTPWWLFEHFNRFWARSFDGGGVSVLKLGPKEAEVLYGRCSLLESSYFRTALRGVATGLVGIVAQRCFMSELPAPAPSRSDEARYRVSWV